MSKICLGGNFGARFWFAYLWHCSAGTKMFFNLVFVISQFNQFSRSSNFWRIIWVTMGLFGGWMLLLLPEEDGFEVAPENDLIGFAPFSCWRYNIP